MYLTPWIDEAFRRMSNTFTLGLRRKGAGCLWDIVVLKKIKKLNKKF
jgi:hypothetical protein